MLVRLEHCHICQCMMFTDKSKSISLSLLLECQPDSELDNGDDAVDHEVDICSKCNTNITKQKWPTLAPDNGLEADSVPPILAFLTASCVSMGGPGGALAPLLQLNNCHHSKAQLFFFFSFSGYSLFHV